MVNRGQAANERCGEHLCLLPYIYFEAPDASIYSGKQSDGKVKGKAFNKGKAMVT